MIHTYPESAGKLTSCEAIWNYISAGRGVVTLKSPSGVHHTYVFRKPAEKEQFPDDVIFVYALHDRQKLFYVGMVEGKEFRVTRNSRFLSTTPIVKGAFYILRMATDPELVTPMELYHEGVCARCGRPLTNPKSIQIGIGPSCRKVHV